MTAAPVLALRDVTLGYQGWAAVDDLTLSISPGQVVALVGGDGAGKTTVLRGLSGRLEPMAGRIDRPDPALVGVVPEGGGTFADLTVAEHLAFAAAAHGLREADHDVVLQRMGLAGARDRLAGRLSGGMRQKLALSMALVHHPTVLLLDEPTTGVDPVSRSEIWRLLSGQVAMGTTVVLATTYLDEAARAGTVVVLEGGRAIGVGAPADICAAVPGAVTVGPTSSGSLAWRRGRQWHTWHPDGRMAGRGWIRIWRTR